MDVGYVRLVSFGATSGSSLPMNPGPQGVQEEFCAVEAGGCVFSIAGFKVVAIRRVVVAVGIVVAAAGGAIVVVVQARL